MRVKNPNFRKRIMRKETTELLGNILVRTRFSGLGKYYAKEVTLDYGTDHQKRVDFVQFIPSQTMTVSGIENGKFVFYEVKSCKEDIYSGNGLNFYGEKNYLVMNMQTWKEFQKDFTDKDSLYSKGRNSYSTDFWPWYVKNHPDGSKMIGIMVAVPIGRDVYDEYENPTEFNDKTEWRLETIVNSIGQPRSKSLVELLFCMLRSGK